MAAAPPSAEELAAKAGCLKKVEPADRAAATAAESGTIANLAKIYTDNAGDAAAIAAATGCLAEKLTASPPANADDFANKFLAGAYSE